MTMTLANYEEYAQESLEKFANRDAASRFLLFDAVKDLNSKEFSMSVAAPDRNFCRFSKKQRILRRR